MSGLCDTCKREPCRMRFNGCKACSIYEHAETRFEKLFGTPEQAAQTLHDRIWITACDSCILRPDCKAKEEELCPLCDYDALLEWLRGDAE